MKFINYIFSGLLLIVFVFSCNSNRAPEPSTTGIESTDLQRTDSTDKKFTEDMDRLRLKIEQRIKEIDADIEKTWKEHKAERNKQKLKAYEKRIEQRELLKKELQEKLDQLEKQTKEGWEKFKLDLEDFFKRDTIRYVAW